MNIKYIFAFVLTFATSCVPMGKDTGSEYDSGSYATDLPGCMITTYCYEASCTELIVFEFLSRSRGSHRRNVESAAKGAFVSNRYYYEGRTDQEACYNYGNGGTYTAY